MRIQKLKKKKALNSYILNIYLFLIRAFFYYNNFGDDFGFNEYINEKTIKYLLNDINEENVAIKNNFIKSAGYFNILILGRPGVGKSTLVNLLSNEKRSMEGKGEAVTRYIVRYIIKEYNISLYDSPGFELDSDINKIHDLVENLNDNLIKAKNQIHLIFYLVSTVGARDFYDTEINILNTLLKYNIPIFFLLTFSPNLEQGNQFKEVVEKNLRRIFKKLDPEKGLKYFEDQVKIFPVHLLDEINEYDNPCKNFGLKTVLFEVYKKFEKYIINEENLNQLYKLLNNKEYEKNNIDSDDDNFNENEIYNKKDIFDILNQNDNIFYKYIKEIDDILLIAKSESQSTINRYTLYSSLIGLLGFITL